MGMRVYFSPTDQAKLRKKIDSLCEKMPVAIARGLNAGGDVVATQVKRALKTQTGLVRYSSVNDRVATTRGFPGQIADGGMQFRIIVKGKPSTKPDEFRYRVKHGPGGGVVVYVWGKPHKFQRSFALYGAAAEGLRARSGQKRFPIHGFRGPNLAKEALVGEAREAFVRASESEVLPRIEMQIARLLR